MKKWRDSVLHGGKRYAMPIMVHPGLELIGASVREAVANGAIQFEGVKALSSSYGSIAATTMMDLSVEADAFGSPLRFFDDETPTVTAPIANNDASIHNLKVPDLHRGRLQEYLKSAGLASAHIKDRPVFACCTGPLSLACRLYGTSELMVAILVEPGPVETLLEKCTQFLTAYAGEFRNRGANGLIMAEPASGLLPADLCRTFSSKYVRQIVDAVQDDYFMMVLHNCGNTDTLLDAMQEARAAGLHFGNKCTMAKALRAINRASIVFGNLDPVGVFAMSSPDEVRNATLSLLQETREFRNFIVSSGCDIPHGVPIENIDSFFDAVKEFNGKQNSIEPDR